jgi:hypothetical protein
VQHSRCAPSAAGPAHTSAAASSKNNEAATSIAYKPLLPSRITAYKTYLVVSQQRSATAVLLLQQVLLILLQQLIFHFTQQLGLGAGVQVVLNTLLL